MDDEQSTVNNNSGSPHVDPQPMSERRLDEIAARLGAVVEWGWVGENLSDGVDDWRSMTKRERGSSVTLLSFCDAAPAQHIALVEHAYHDITDLYEEVQRLRAVAERLTRAYVAVAPREVMRCPHCNAQHIDIGEWASRPHHTHQCQHCYRTFDNGRWSFGATVADSVASFDDAVKQHFATLMRNDGGAE